MKTSGKAETESNTPGSLEARWEPAGGPARPAGLRWAEERKGAHYRAKLGHSRALAVPVLGFAAAWNGFLFVWYTRALAGSSGGIMHALPLLHVVAGIVITYVGLCLLVNSSHAAFDDATFTFRKGPLPQLGRVRLPLDDLRGFSVAATRSPNEGERALMWDAVAETRDGQGISLQLEQPDEERAAYIVWHLQLALDRAQHKQLESYRD